MKTVRIGTEIVRESDDKVMRIVDEGRGTYCPKSEWKKLRVTATHDKK